MITTLLLIAGFLGQSEAPPPEIPVHGEPLTLEQALKYAEENNERIGQAHAAVERARAQYWQAMSALLPRLDLSGTYIRRRNEATALNDAGETVFFQRQNALQSIAQLNMSVIRPDQYPRVSAATDEIDASKQDAKNERLQLRFDAAEQFFLLLARQGLADAAKERVRVAQSQVDEARARFEAGLAAANTVTRAELELATAKVTLTQSETEAQLARLQLSFLIGVDVQGELVLPANGTATTSDPDRLIEVARSERPDLRALRYRKDAAESRQLAPLLDWLPELSVRAFYSLTNEPGFGPNDNYNFSATLGWQLFDGGARIAEDIQASADYQDLTLQIRNLERNIRLEVRNQLQQLEARKAIVAEANARFEVARRNNDEVRERLKAGLVTGLEAADSAAELFQAEASLAQANFDQRITELALRRALASDPLDAVAAGAPNAQGAN